MRLLRCSLLVASVLALSSIAAGQKPDDVNAEEDGFGFVRDTMLPCTPVKNQANTSTCWCFATNSFLEAELLRTPAAVERALGLPVLGAIPTASGPKDSSHTVAQAGRVGAPKTA